MNPGKDTNLLSLMRKERRVGFDSRTVTPEKETYLLKNRRGSTQKNTVTPEKETYLLENRKGY